MRPPYKVARSHGTPELCVAGVLLASGQPEQAGLGFASLLPVSPSEVAKAWKAAGPSHLLLAILVSLSSSSSLVTTVLPFSWVASARLIGAIFPQRAHHPGYLCCGEVSPTDSPWGTAVWFWCPPQAPGHHERGDTISPPPSPKEAAAIPPIPHLFLEPR